MEKLQMLKNLFDEFLNETHDTVHRVENKEFLKLNAEVFEFQSHVYQALKSTGINLILDPIIESENVKASFSTNARAISPQDYCLSFLDFLNVEKNSKKELVVLIDHFIERHKEELTWQDIVITASGATRCKTNIRFALNQLRKLGLINKLDEDGQRILTPRLEGEIVFYYWRRLKNIQSFRVLWNSHYISIHDASFSALFSILNQVSRLNHVEILQDIRKIKEIRLYNESSDQVELFLLNINNFLETAVLTEKGVYLRREKN